MFTSDIAIFLLGLIAAILAGTSVQPSVATSRSP